MPTIEVFADVSCPFTHVALRRLVDKLAETGRLDVRVRVRAWPLELVNGRPLDPEVVAEEVDELRSTVAPDLFTGFDEATFPGSSLPALELAAAAYAHSDERGEQVSLALRWALFEEGRNVGDLDVLRQIAGGHGLEVPAGTYRDTVIVDWHEGQQRGVVGSPHFFVGERGGFCPALDIHRDDAGRLHVATRPGAFEEMLAAL